MRADSIARLHSKSGGIRSWATNAGGLSLKNGPPTLAEADLIAFLAAERRACAYGKSAHMLDLCDAARRGAPANGVNVARQGGPSE
jgi:hypothetical protein